MAQHYFEIRGVILSVASVESQICCASVIEQYRNFPLFLVYVKLIFSYCLALENGFE